MAAKFPSQPTDGMFKHEHYHDMNLTRIVSKEAPIQRPLGSTVELRNWVGKMGF